MKYKSVKGMDDILPQDVWLWQELESRARKELESSGYVEIRTPILEETAVFIRGIGETTDIVTKEMFTFSDRKERSLTMRPEGTAPIVRSYIEHSLGNISPVLRLYYIGPMFRAERPQKGRSRQFHQIGVEVIGSFSPYADVEVLAQLDKLLKAFGLSGYVIKLNSLGCKSDKLKFTESLKQYLADKINLLCEDCRNRVGKNVLRVLDCKKESCTQAMRGAPNILDNMCLKCARHFEEVKSSLKALGINFQETKNLVRGLDYYTATVFEITHPALGTQDAIGAGGRYDNLIKDMGGECAGAVGYALGLERIILALKGHAARKPDRNVIYIATLGDAARLEGLKISESLKDGLALPNLVVLRDMGEASLKSQMRSADRQNAKVVIILGEDEMKEKKLTIKDMRPGGSQVSVAAELVVEEVRRILC
ncbi:MAG: histidine--tRNA ligase [Candidatus Omnitrophica bacterium]|nr:histidine--tRNA ligase [Candidatus Omnitrophota bacterium]